MKHECTWSLRTSQALSGLEKEERKGRGSEITDLIRSQDECEGTLRMHELLCKKHTHIRHWQVQTVNTVMDEG